MKKPPMKPDNKTGKKGKSRQFNVFLLLGIAALLLVRYLSHQILHYPRLVFYSCWVLAFMIYSALDYKKNKSDFMAKNTRDDPFVPFFLFKLLIWIVWSLFYTAIFLIPFNATLILCSKNSPAETIQCNITDADTHVGGWRINQPEIAINFKGRKYEYIECDQEMALMLSTNLNYLNYDVLITVRKSILGSYILENYNIVGRYKGN